MAFPPFRESVRLAEQSLYSRVRDLVRASQPTLADTGRPFDDQVLRFVDPGAGNARPFEA